MYWCELKSLIVKFRDSKWLERLGISPGQIFIMILLFVALISGIMLNQHQGAASGELLSRSDQEPFIELNVKVAEIESLWYAGRKSGPDIEPLFNGSKININRATEEELILLPGIGPALAKRIFEFRKTNGWFPKIEDLKKVKGIGEKKLKKMKPYITLKK